jgi:hypothetical protein
MSVGAIEDWIIPIGAGCIGIGLGQSGLEDLVLGVILRVETRLSASVVAKAVVLDHRQLAVQAALLKVGLQILHLERCSEDQQQGH